MPRVRAISRPRASGVGCVNAVKKPRAPAFATAATSSALPTCCMPPCTTGCRTPKSSVNRVVSMNGKGWPGSSGQPSSGRVGRLRRPNRRSGHRVLDGLDGPGADALARGLRSEHLLLLGEGIDPLTSRPRRLLDDNELREAVEDEEAVLLELLVTDADQRLDDLLHVLPGDLFSHCIRH